MRPDQCLGFAHDGPGGGAKRRSSGINARDAMKKQENYAIQDAN